MSGRLGIDNFSQRGTDTHPDTLSINASIRGVAYCILFVMAEKVVVSYHHQPSLFLKFFSVICGRSLPLEDISPF